MKCFIRILILPIGIIMFFGCNNNVQRKVVNSEIVVGHYINDSSIDGIAKYYD